MLDSEDSNIFMGTIILTGKAKAKVIATGMSTEMGKIADMLHSIENEKSPLKERLDHLGKSISCTLYCNLYCCNFNGYLAWSR